VSLPKLLQDSCLPQFLSVTDPNDPTSDLYGVQLHGTVFRGNRIYRSFSSIWYGTSLVLHRSSRRHSLGLFHRLSSLLGHRLCRGTVQRNQDTDTQSVEDYSAGCNMLFPGHIHFTFRVRDVPLVRKRKHIVIIYHPFSTACSHFYRIQSSCSLPRK